MSLLGGLSLFQTSLQTNDPSADPCLQPVTWCLSVTEPVKVKSLFPQVDFLRLRMEEEEGVITVAWLVDGHLNYSGS